MSLSHLDPLANLRVFEDAFSRMLSEPQSNRPWAPAVDIFDTENELLLKADLPGVEMKDIDIQLENGTLTLRGESKQIREWQKELAKVYAPHRIVIAIPSDAKDLPPALAEKKPVGEVVAYVCRGSVCSAPIDTFSALVEQLRSN